MQLDGNLFLGEQIMSRKNENGYFLKLRETLGNYHV